MLKPLVSLFLILALSSSLFTQNELTARFSHYGEDDGISNTATRAIVMDNDGYLWVGTQNGLNRFDGSEIRTYYSDTSLTSISDGKVNHLHLATDNTLWVATEGGLCKYNPVFDNFTRFENQVNDSTIRSRTEMILEDNSGSLWIAYENLFPSSGGIARFDPVTGQFENFMMDNPLGVMEIIQDGNEPEIYWAAAYGSLVRVNSGKGESEVFTCEECHGYNFIFQCLRELDSENILIPALNDGLYSFNKVDQTWTKLNDVRTINHLTQKSEGEWWLSSGSHGLSIYYDQTNTLEHYSCGEIDDYTLPKNSVFFSFEDKNKKLWIAHTYGFSLLDPAMQDFQYKRYHADEDSEYTDSDLRYSTVPPGSDLIYTGTRNGEGILFIDKTTFEIKNRVNQYSNPEDFGEPILIKTITHLNKDTLLFVSYKGIYLYNIATDKIEKLLDANQDEYKDNIGFQISNPHKGLIAISGRHNGFILLNYKDKSHRFVKLSEETFPRKNSVGSVQFDNSGMVWVGSNYVRGMYNPETKKLTNLETLFPSYHPSKSGLIRMLEVYNDSLIYFGSQTKGLLEFNLKTKKYLSVANDGLEGQFWVSDLLKAGDDNIWAITDKGVLKWSPISRKSRWFKKQDGLPKSNWYLQYLSEGADESVILSSENTLVRFYPKSLGGSEERPSVELNEFSIAGILIESDTAINRINRVNLEAGENNFSFTYSGISYTNPALNSYAYKLEGFEEDWHQVGNRKFGAYTNVDGGDYTLKIKVANADGVWSDKVQELKIHIDTLYYKTPWFITLVIVLFLVLVVGTYQFRLKQIKKQSKLEDDYNKKIAEVEMTALRAQMNPHFLFNCLNSIKYFIIKNKAEEAADYLTKFSRLIRLILNNSKTELVVLESELEALDLYIQMESLRFDEKFEYSINLSKNVNAEFIEIPPLLLQPFVENSIWHGLLHKEEAGQINVNIEVEGDTLICEIDDDGIGREKAAEYKSKTSTKRKSMGMQITSNRLEVINKLYNTEAEVKIIDKKTELGVSLGTKVIIKIPV